MGVEYRYWITPEIKGRIIQMSKFNKRTQEILKRGFEYSDDAHDAAQGVFRNAKVSVRS